MKKIIVFLIFLLFAFPNICVGQATSINVAGKPTGDWLKNGGVKDLAWRWMQEIDALVSIGANPGTGTIWYVDSGVVNEGDGSSWLNAFDTVDEAINASLADGGAARGDWLAVAQGHAESGTDADLWDADVAGLTIWHLGNGSSQGTYTFSDTDTTVSIGAANVTIKGGRLLAGISEVVIGMDVTAAADYLTVIGMEFPDPSDSSFEFDIAVQLVTGADDISFLGCKAYSADATGATYWLNGGASAVNRLTLIGNIIIGEYTAGIFSDQADLECEISYNTVTNMTSNEDAIEFTGNATGWLKYNVVSTDAIGTSIDPGRMGDVGNMWDDFDTYDTTAVPWTTNETGVNRWGATELAQIEGEATDALEADLLHQLSSAADGGSNVYPDSIVQESVIAFILSKSADPVTTSYDNTSDSLEAISDAVGAITDNVSTAVPEPPTAKSLQDILHKDGSFTYDNTSDSLEAIRDNQTAAVTTSLEADFLHFLYSAADGGTNPYPDSVVSQSALAFIMSVGANPVVTTFDNTTDSLQAISEALAAGTGATAAIEADLLDLLASAADGGSNVYPDSVVQESILAFILSSAANPVTTSYDNTTDSLEALGTATAAILADTAAIDPGAPRLITKTLTNLSAAIGDNAIFVVAGGPVRVIELFGLVTVQLDGAANVLYKGVATAPGGDVSISTATALGNPDAVGTIIGTNATFGGATIRDAAGTVATGTTFIQPIGDIEFNISANTGADDEIVFYLRYEPMVAGAAVTAAP